MEEFGKNKVTGNHNAIQKQIIGDWARLFFYRD